MVEKYLACGILKHGIHFTVVFGLISTTVKLLWQVRPRMAEPAGPPVGRYSICNTLAVSTAAASRLKSKHLSRILCV